GRRSVLDDFRKVTNVDARRRPGEARQRRQGRAQISGCLTQVNVDMPARRQGTTNELERGAAAPLPAERENQVGVMEIADLEPKRARVARLVEKVVQLDGIGPIFRENRFQPGVTVQ